MPYSMCTATAPPYMRVCYVSTCSLPVTDTSNTSLCPQTGWAQFGPKDGGLCCQRGVHRHKRAETLTMQHRYIVLLSVLAFILFPCLSQSPTCTSGPESPVRPQCRFFLIQFFLALSRKKKFEVKDQRGARTHTVGSDNVMRA